jgi:hypothetical protein
VRPLALAIAAAVVAGASVVPGLSAALDIVWDPRAAVPLARMNASSARAGSRPPSACRRFAPDAIDDPDIGRVVPDTTDAWITWSATERGRPNDAAERLSTKRPGKRVPTRVPRKTVRGNDAPRRT